jgi:hypothetical protein
LAMEKEKKEGAIDDKVIWKSFQGSTEKEGR